MSWQVTDALAECDSTGAVLIVDCKQTVAAALEANPVGTVVEVECSGGKIVTGGATYYGVNLCVRPRV